MYDDEGSKELQHRHYILLSQLQNMARELPGYDYILTFTYKL